MKIKDAIEIYDGWLGERCTAGDVTPCGGSSAYMARKTESHRCEGLRASILPTLEEIYIPALYSFLFPLSRSSVVRL